MLIVLYDRQMLCEYIEFAHSMYKTGIGERKTKKENREEEKERENLNVEQNAHREMIEEKRKEKKRKGEGGWGDFQRQGGKEKKTQEVRTGL